MRLLRQSPGSPACPHLGRVWVLASLALVALAAATSCVPAPPGNQSDARIGPLPTTQPPAPAANAKPSQPASETTTVASSAAQPPGRPGYKLVFQDEFNGTKLDKDTWAQTTPFGTRFTTGELEYYDPANTTVADGNLRILTEKQKAHGYKYTSGIITSLNRPKFQYGYYEMRAKLPSGQGIWPAFWLTNDDDSEIDVLEMLGHRPYKVYFVLHFKENKQWNKRWSFTLGPNYSEDFHIYAVDWQPTSIKWYIDGVETWTFTERAMPKPQWLVVNTAVGGEWAGPPDSTTDFPQEYLVDYIRVYEKQ